MMTIQKQALGQSPVVVLRPMDFREMKAAWNAMRNSEFIEGRKVVSVEPSIISVSDGTRYYKG